MDIFPRLFIPFEVIGSSENQPTVANSEGPIVDYRAALSGVPKLFKSLIVSLLHKPLEHLGLILVLDPYVRESFATWILDCIHILNQSLREIRKQSVAISAERGCELR